MSNPTSNFGWQMPTNFDLVTDLPADFEVFGQGVDTTLADLKGGTTGQMLTKATNADMDFTWVTPEIGDITAVTASSPLTGGGTSGAITVGIQDGTTSQKGAVQLEDSTSSTSTTKAATPNSVKTSYDLANAAIPKSLVDAKGDIVIASADNTPARLGVGSDYAILQSLSSANNGLSYGGKLTSYTPTWAAAITNPVLGNGAIEGYYVRVGDLVYFNIKLVMGSTTTYGSGAYTFSLPIPMTATFNGFTSQSYALDAGVAWYRGFFAESTPNGYTDKINLVKSDGTVMTNTVPFTFGNQDAIYVWGVYHV